VSAGRGIRICLFSFFSGERQDFYFPIGACPALDAEPGKSFAETIKEDEEIF
jgi:hypothetical protein